jgi:hypothetical protein
VSIEKDVTVKVNTQVAGGAGDPFKSMATGAKGAAADTKGIDKAIGDLNASIQRLAQNMGQGWKAGTDGVTVYKGRIVEATGALERFTSAHTRANQVAGGFGGGGGGGFNARSMGIMGRMMGMGGQGLGMARLGMGMGATGLGIGAALMIGSQAMTSGIRHQFEGELSALGQPLQKSDLGVIERMGYGARDYFSGREYRERITELRGEKQLQEVARENAMRQIGTSASNDQMAFMSHTGGLSSANAIQSYGRDPAAAMRLEMDRLDAQRRMVENRMAAGAPARIAADQERASAFGRIKGGGNRLQALKDEQVALEKQRGLMQQQAQDAAKIVELDKQRVQVAGQIAAATKQQTVGQRNQFAAMDDSQRERVIALGARLKKGEKLAGAELEEANQFELLRPMIQEQRAKEVDQSGDFARLMKAIGTDEQKAAADKAETARAQGGDVRVETYLDEAKLADKIAEKGFDFVDKIKVIIDKKVQELHTALEKNNKNQQMWRGAANPG